MEKIARFLSVIFSPRKWWIKRKTLINAVAILNINPKWWWTISKIRDEWSKQQKPHRTITWQDLREMLRDISGVNEAWLSDEMVSGHQDRPKLMIKTSWGVKFEDVYDSVENILKEKTPILFFTSVDIIPWENPKNRNEGKK
jgi:hypothetical protein